MNRSILASGTLAVAIHALLFALPLSKLTSGTRAPIHEPISISIIHPEEAVAAVPQVEVCVEAQIQPRSEAKSHGSGRWAVISKDELTFKRPSTADRTAVKKDPLEEIAKPELASSGENQEDTVKESSVDRMQENGSKETDRSLPVRTVSIRSAGERGVATPPVGEPGRDIIVDARPKYKENPLPHYPKVARRRGYEGRTVLRVEVLESGKVGRIEIATSSGFEVLDKAALGSVNGWIFFPGTRNGKKTKQWVVVPVRFTLR
ncbi:MAG: energy transducer TonB [Desulfobacterales bacterium]|nr:MAG: energy transducer TonB [Desulfobacterales bacterium]